jgi:hypothetical protein
MDTRIIGEAIEEDGVVGACDEKAVDVEGKPITAILQTLRELESIKEIATMVTVQTQRSICTDHF